MLARLAREARIALEGCLLKSPRNAAQLHAYIMMTDQSLHFMVRVRHSSTKISPCPALLPLDQGLQQLQGSVRLVLLRKQANTSPLIIGSHCPSLRSEVHAMDTRVELPA